jgi:hypothetical protein
MRPPLVLAAVLAFCLLALCTSGCCTYFDPPYPRRCYRIKVNEPRKIRDQPCPQDTPEDYSDSIAAGEVVPGMDMDEVRAALGVPKAVDPSINWVGRCCPCTVFLYAPPTKYQEVVFGKGSLVWFTRDHHSSEE